MQLIINKIYQFLESQSRSFLLGLGFIAEMLITILNYNTGRNFEVDFFYLIPLGMVTWFTNLEWGISTAVLVTVLLFVVDSITGKISGSWVMDGWNALFEFAFFLTFVSLLTILKRKVKELEELASEDSLTKVANRRAFYRAAQTEMNRSQRFGLLFSIAYIDIDNFKRINDTNGHTVGDGLLRDVASTFLQNIRNIDMVARIGGDEFAILFPHTDAEEVKFAVEKIQKHLNELAASHQWQITFSIGVMTFSQPPASVEEMIGLTDGVMYSVKKKGKNNTAYEMWPDSD